MAFLLYYMVHNDNENGGKDSRQRVWHAAEAPERFQVPDDTTVWGQHWQQSEEGSAPVPLLQIVLNPAKLHIDA